MRFTLLCKFDYSSFLHSNHEFDISLESTHRLPQTNAEEHTFDFQHWDLELPHILTP